MAVEFNVANGIDDRRVPAEIFHFLQGKMTFRLVLADYYILSKWRMFC